MPEADWFVNDHGYIEVWNPEHPHQHKGYVLEHRFIVEKHIGRILDSDEVVHHINEVKTDNRIGNLYLCTPAEHVRIHNREKTFSTERKNNIRKGVRQNNRKKKSKKSNR